MLSELQRNILRKKEEVGAVILAHYYQEEEIQEIADFIGDSLELSRRAQSAKEDVIAFCGVKFMAEVAKILNPSKKVIIPDERAGCSLEKSCPPDAFARFKRQHSDHICITYINCSAEIKALSDIIVTSSNAKKIIEKIPVEQKIIFAPDKYLGSYLNKITGRNMLLWEGSCIVHETFSERELIKLTIKHPEAIVIAHPECPENLLSRAHFIGSTSALLRHVEANQGAKFIVLTEPGILYKMRLVNASAAFFPVPGALGPEGACINCNNCPYMKMNSLEKLYNCMDTLSPEINLEDTLLEKASLSLNRMLEMS